jgi:hypothetical protein
MGKIGDPFTQPQPTLLEAGPAWASDNNGVTTELIARVAVPVDGPSIVLTQGEFPHATRTNTVAAADGQGSGTTWTKGAGATAGYHLAVGATDTVEYGSRLQTFQRLRNVFVTGRSVATAWTARLWLIDQNSAGGTRTQVGTTLTSAALTSVERLAIPGMPALGVQLAAGQSLVLEWTSGAAATRSMGCEFAFDRAVGT